MESPAAPAAQAKAPRKLAKPLGLAAAAIGLVIAVILLSRARGGPPARCAPGMIPLEARCCGEGQTLLHGQCKGRPSACAEGLAITDEGCVATPRAVRLSGGTFRIGPGDWEAQGQIEPRDVTVAAFALDAYEITESRYAACIAAAACAPLPLKGEPGRPIASITASEAAAFCAWAGGSLPTPEQLAFAAAGLKGRRYAWGDTGAVCRRAAWGLVQGPCGQNATGPEIAGSHPDGASPEGIHDLAGNVAEWAVNEGEKSFAEARGGSYADSAASALRSWNRQEIPKTSRSAEVGFRCAYPPPKDPTP